MAKKRGNSEGTIRYNKARKRWEGRITIEYVPKLDSTGKALFKDVRSKRTGRIERRPVLKERRKMVTGQTQIEVIHKLSEARTELAGGFQPATKHDTLGRFLDRWLTEVLPGTVSQGTLTNYDFIARRYVIPSLGTVPLAQLSPEHVRQMLRKLDQTRSVATGRRLSDNTLRLSRSVLRRALRFAEAEGLVSRNAAALADPIRREAHGQTGRKYLTVEQGRAILEHVEGTPHEAAFTVLLMCGLRRGELLGLSWPDVDFETNQLLVGRQLQRRERVGEWSARYVLESTKTRGSRRTIVMPAAVARSLKRHRGHQKHEQLRVPDWQPSVLGVDLVFRNADGGPLNPDTFRNHCYRVTIEALGERFSPHAFRHAAASFMLAAGVPAPRVSEALGHSSIRVTLDVYSHLFTEGKAETAAAMDAILFD